MSLNLETTFTHSSKSFKVKIWANVTKTMKESVFSVKQMS